MSRIWRWGPTALAAALISISSPARGALNKTYPTSAVTGLRVLAYEDGIYTIAKSTYAVQLSTWDSFGSTYTWVSTGTVVYGWTTDTSTVPWRVQPASWTVSDYTSMVVEETKLRMINQILDDDFEQYMVWPSTTPPAPGQWKGWCLSIVNGHNVPIVCP